MTQKPRTVHGEEVNYWKTSQTQPDTWIERAKKEITSIRGKVLSEMYGSDENGRAAFVLMFTLGEDTFKLIWPVLPSREGNVQAARIQAATMMYHDVKAKVVSAKALGTRAAFFQYLLLPNGQSASEVGAADLVRLLPEVLSLPRPDSK